MLQHGVGNYSLARLSFGIEFGKPEERNQHHDSEDGDNPQGFVVLDVHVLSMSYYMILAAKLHIIICL